MRRPPHGTKLLPSALAAAGLMAGAATSSAQWSRVTDVPGTEVHSVWANGDTIAAGADTAVYVSTNAGTTWRISAKPAAAVAAIEAVWIRDGVLYAGTFGQGAFVSHDLGATWAAFNEGLVGGLFDSQLDLSDFQVRSDSLYAATEGAGVYVRGLSDASTWQHFGDVFEPNQASDVNSLGLGGERLLASAGGNGMVFVHDPGDADWTVSDLDNVGIHAGLQPETATWTGAGWVVGTNLGTFLSATGREPWIRSDPGLGPLFWTALAAQGANVFAAFDVANAAVVEASADAGATWQDPQVLLGVFVERMAFGGASLYAARGDGLWRLPLTNASVAAGGSSGRLRLSLAGAQPCRNEARLRFELPRPGVASVQLFDVLGRAAGARVEGSWSSGPHELTLETRRIEPGVYVALLRAGGERALVRLVHVR